MTKRGADSSQKLSSGAAPRPESGDMPDPSIQSVSDALARCRSLFVAVALFGVFANILLLAGPIYMLQIYDRVLSSGSIPTLVVLTLIVGVAYATLAVIDNTRSKLAARVGLRLDRLLGERLVRGAWGRSSAGSIAQGSDLLRALDSYRGFVGGAGLLVATDLPFTLVFIVVISLLHPYLGMFAVAAIFLLACLAVLAQLATRRQMRESQEAAKINSRRVLNVATGAEAVRAMGMGAQLGRLWRQERNALVSKKTHASDVGGAFKATSKSLRFFIQSAMLGLGAWLVIQSELTPGGMIAGSIILGRAMAPIDQALGAFQQWSAARGARTELDAALADIAETAPLPQSRLPAITGAIDLEDLGYVPSGAGAPVLSKISLSIPAGASVGLIGPSGVGKSTLLRLLLGVLQPTHGAVRLDGAELSQYAPESLGPQVGYLPQDVVLLNGTIGENIARFCEGRDDEVVRAGKTANAHELILRLPNGYDTIVGEKGITLSAGQRQRIGLARAVFGAPALVVLDEPNANLDEDGARALARTILALKHRNVTVIMATHRLEALAAVDKLLALLPGQRALYGPRDAVLKKTANEAPRKTAQEEPGEVANA